MLLHASSLLLVMCMMNEAVSSMVRGAIRPSTCCMYVCMYILDTIRHEQHYTHTQHNTQAMMKQEEEVLKVFD